MAIQNNTINGEIGDFSYFDRFGSGNVESLGNIERIQLHLEYVDKVLRNAPIEHLSELRKQRRENIIEKLRGYRLKGKFPKHNTASVSRKTQPRFIDHKGTFCAVGQLMVETGDKALAERINDEYEYEYVEDIHSAELLQWACSHGLSARDCAMIQPAYPLPEAPTECPATALWNSRSEEKVLTLLRAFRDENMKTNKLGRLAVRGYYKLSSSITARIISRPIEGKLLKIALTPLVLSITFAKRVR